MENRSDNQLVLETTSECTIRSQAMQFLALGDRLGWQMQILGKAPMPEEPIRLHDWLLMPAYEDTTALPRRTMKRIQTIHSEGLFPKGFVVVHEAPMQLAAPKPSPSIQEKQAIEWEGLGKFVGSIARVLGTIALGSVLLPMGLVVGLVMLDPILVAVTQDGYWIEIDRWIA